MRDKHGLSPGEASAGKEGAPQPSVKRQKPSTRRKRNRHPVAIGIAAAFVVGGIALYFVKAPSLVQPPFGFITSESYIHVHPYL